MNRAQRILEIFRPRRLGVSFDSDTYGGTTEYRKEFGLPTGDYSLKIDFDKNDQSLYLGFERDGEIDSRKNRSSSDVSQGYKDLLIVFREMSNILDHSIRRHPFLKTISYHGNRDDQTRSRMYTHLAQSIAKRYGGTPSVQPEGGYVRFIITLR